MFGHGNGIFGLVSIGDQSLRRILYSIWENGKHKMIFFIVCYILICIDTHTTFLAL